MRPGAVGLALEQRRPAAGPGAPDRLAGRFGDRAHVVAVDLDARDAVGRAAAARRSGCRRRSANGTSVANWLFSQTNSTGSFQMLAMFSPSWKAPLFTAPSPKNATATRSVFSSLKL